MLHMVIILMIKIEVVVWRAHAVVLEKGSLKACLHFITPHCHLTCAIFSLLGFFLYLYLMNMLMCKINRENSDLEETVCLEYFCLDILVSMVSLCGES